MQVIYDKARKNTFCPYCGTRNGQVQKIGALKLVHLKYKPSSAGGGGGGSKKEADFLNKELKKQFENLLANHKDIDESKIQEPINPVMALNLFEQIRDEDIPLLLMNKVSKNNIEILKYACLFL